ncbi:hypothetical protein Ndes2437A_g00332 [Nannochloris sp. 'desiccata']|nr:hypothetical protein KSW81_002639 [Chlorella desiccata (nom. nud.)]
METSHLFHKCVAWWRGYSKDQVKLAFQIFLSFCIVLAIISPYPVWNALSFGSITPPLALVFAMLLAPQHQGGATLSAIFLAVGILLGGGLALAVKYLAYFANGSNWVDHTAVKGVVYTLGIAVSGGILNALRWQWEITNQLFLLSCAGLVLAGGIGTYFSASLLPASVLYTLSLTTLASVITLACCWFIFPVTAGSKYRQLIAKALDLTAEAISAYEALVLGPVDPQSGRLIARTGKIDPCSDTDEGLTPVMDEIRKNLQAARMSLFASRALHLPVRLEVDVYNRPKRFPYMEFMHIKIELSLIIATVATLARPVKRGRINLTLFQQPELRKQFSQLLTCLKNQLHVLAGVAQAQKKWTEADMALEELDSAWVEFVDEAVMVVDGCTNPDAAYGLRGTSAFLYLVGSRTRSLYAALAGAMEGKDPEAISIAMKRMEITPGWVKSADAFRNPLRTRQATLAAMQKAAQQVNNEFIINLGFMNKNKLKKATKKKGTGKEDSTSVLKASATQKSFFALISAAHAMGSSPTRRARQRVYNFPLPIIFGIQYAVALGIAIGLSVVPVIWKKGFHERPIDVCITVAVVWQPNIGSIHGRALNRIMGTTLAAIWSYVLLSLSFAATGGTWDNNTPGKFVVAGFLAAVWAGFCTANMLRYSAKQYAWLVAGVTVPLVTLTLLRTGTSPPWDIVAWRLVNVCMGVGIVWIVSFTVLPLSARTVVNANFSAALSSMAELLRQLPQHLTPAEARTQNGNATVGQPSSPRLSGHSSKSLSVSSPSSPFGSASPIAGTHDFRQAFFAPIHAAPLRLALRVQRALADVSLSIPALESEYLPLHHLHRVPQGATAKAAHAAQLMLDFCNITFSLKMENSHLGPWRIPALQHTHMTAIASSVAQALDSLRDVVLGDIKSIKITLKCLDEVEEGIARQIQETLASAINSPLAGIAAEETVSEEISMEKGEDNQPNDKILQVQQEVLLLLYMGISVSQQLKILCSATARAFLAQDEAVVAEIDRKALEINGFGDGSSNDRDNNEAEQAATHGMSAASSRAQGLEYLMARVLEHTHAWPTSRSASSIIEAADLSGTVPAQEEEQNEELKEVVTRAT